MIGLPLEVAGVQDIITFDPAYEVVIGAIDEGARAILMLIILDEGLSP